MSECQACGRDSITMGEAVPRVDYETDQDNPDGCRIASCLWCNRYIFQVPGQKWKHLQTSDKLCSPA